MKRNNIELLIAFLDALRRDDRGAMRSRLRPDVVWQGVEVDQVCRSAEEVIDVFVASRDEQYEVERLELIGADHHVILHADDSVHNVFAVDRGVITRIDDFADRAAAFAAAGLEGP